MSLLSGPKDLVEGGDSWFDGNNDMADALERKGYPYRYMVGNGEHFPPFHGAAEFPGDF